jgi:hypothetical protein
MEEDLAPPEVSIPTAGEEAEVPVSAPAEGEETRLEELTSPELLPSPALEEIVALESISPTVEASTGEEEMPEPVATAEVDETAITSVPGVKEDIHLEELTAPESIPANELEELIAPMPSPTIEELPQLEELSAPESLPTAGLADFAVPEPIPPTAESPLEDLTSPELMAAPEMTDLSELPPTPAAEEATYLGELTSVEEEFTPPLMEMEETAAEPPPPPEETIPPPPQTETAPTATTPMPEEMPNLDEIVRPPEPPITDKLESIDDLLGESAVPEPPTQPPTPTPPDDFPEFEDWLDRIKDQNA